jgi:23S rRNA (adenine2503-C2)-methyltransferase
MADPSVLDLTFEELAARLSDQPGYRAEQVWHGLFRDLVSSYEEISTLPKSLRLGLTESIPLPILDLVTRTTSQDDRTAKSLHRLADDETIESVTMIYPDRATACVSSQVGCPIGCPFCATGQAGFVRDLTAGEIVAQVLDAARCTRRDGARLSNVVYMGMGEPFLNYDAVLRSIRILNDARGFALGARSFTVSTAGIPEAIDRFSREGIQANLAVSLHAGDDRLRDRLVPVNRRYPIDLLLDACRRYTETTHRRITFEVALIGGVNDSDADAATLARRIAELLCHVNLIPCNPTAGSASSPSAASRLRAFRKILEDGGVPTTIRESMGAEIDAACGQLRAKASDKGEKPG